MERVLILSKKIEEEGGSTPHMIVNENITIH